ncbi:MAG: hypothetical protein Phog2KO_48620 [Phototrophicaceae bacterium]
MPSQNLPPLSEWQALFLRLTIFPAPDENFDGRDWWESLVGSEPELQQRDKQTGERIYAGTFLNGHLTLSMLPTRINWIYSAINNEIVTLNEIPSIGKLEDEINLFGDSIKEWLSKDCPNVFRIALGTRSIQPLDTVKDVYERLAMYIPVEIDSENSSDFIYRINRRRKSNVINNLELNRLSTWSAMRAQLEMETVGMPHLRHTQEKYACSMELDINTVPNSDIILGNDNLIDIFLELIDLGSEIARKGDIR